MINNYFEISKVMPAVLGRTVSLGPELLLRRFRKYTHIQSSDLFAAINPRKLVHRELGIMVH